MGHAVLLGAGRFGHIRRDEQVIRCVRWQLLSIFLRNCLFCSPRFSGAASQTPNFCGFVARVLFSESTTWHYRKYVLLKLCGELLLFLSSTQVPRCLPPPARAHHRLPRRNLHPGSGILRHARLHVRRASLPRANKQVGWGNQRKGYTGASNSVVVAVAAAAAAAAV